jgi:glycosyltransferase involved in cell wall biosynthesis
MKTPYISIITVTKNAEKTIERTIESVKKQDYHDHEHIIIDAASDDATISYVRFYAEKYSVKYLSEPDRGIADAFNKALSLSSGQWILFIGSGDELIHPGVLSHMHSILKDHEDLLIVWGNVIFKDIKGRTGQRYRGNFSRYMLKVFMCFSHQSIFHNRALFDRYGLFDEEIKIAMDYDILLRAYNEIKNGYIDYDIAYMLIGGQSQYSAKKAVKDMLKVQLKHKVTPVPVAYGIYYWTLFKVKIKNIMGYSTTFGFKRPYKG